MQTKQNKYFLQNSKLAYKSKMSMINNFRVTERMCGSHSQPCPYILIQNCRMKLVCNKCLVIYQALSLQNNVNIMSVDTFKQYLQRIIQNWITIDVRKIVQEKKKQFQQRQYRLLEQLMRKVNRDKENLFTQLDLLEKYYISQQNKFSANIQQREQIIKYLKQFCIDHQLLSLKLLVSNQYGLSSFLSQVKSLQLLGQQHPGRNISVATKQIYNQLKNKQQNSLVFKLQKSLKKQVEQKIAKVMPLLNIPICRPKIPMNQATQRRNQSQQNIQMKSPRTSRANSYSQLPKMIIG